MLFKSTAFLKKHKPNHFQHENGHVILKNLCRNLRWGSALLLLVYPVGSLSALPPPLCPNPSLKSYFLFYFIFISTLFTRIWHCSRNVHPKKKKKRVMPPACKMKRGPRMSSEVSKPVALVLLHVCTYRVWMKNNSYSM